MHLKNKLLTAAFNLSHLPTLMGDLLKKVLGLCFSSLWTSGDVWQACTDWNQIGQKNCGSCVAANISISDPVRQEQVGELTVLASRLGGLLIGLGLVVLLSPNSFLLNNREKKQKGVRSEATVSSSRSALSVCIWMHLRRQHAWLLPQAPAACLVVCVLFLLCYKHLNYTSPHFFKHPQDRAYGSPNPIKTA